MELAPYFALSDNEMGRGRLQGSADMKPTPGASGIGQGRWAIDWGGKRQWGTDG